MKPSHLRGMVAGWRLVAGEVSKRLLLAWGVAAILLGSSGIAAVIAWTPASNEAEVQLPSARIEGETRVRAKCPECGVVESVRAVSPASRQPGASFDPATAGDDEMAGKSTEPTERYEITVRMKDGASRVFINATPANWRQGERVTFIEGASQSND